MIQAVTLNDPRVRDYRATTDPEALRERGLFVAEGRLVVRRLLEARRFAGTHPEEAPYAVRSVLVTQAALSDLGTVLDARPTVAVYLIDQEAMNATVGFNIHRGCLALAERPAPTVFDAQDVSGLSRVLVVEGVSNPDNIGGLFRNAAALGVELVLLGPGCGDPLYRKAIRTSMGSTLLVRFTEAAPWPGAIATLKRAGFQILGLTPAADATPLPHITPMPRAAVILGSEGDGLSDRALAECDVRVRIPMRTLIDSLNVATAAAVALYHLCPLDDR